MDRFYELGKTLASFKISGNTPICRLILIICSRNGIKASEASLSIFGLIPSIPVDLLGSRDFNMDFNSSDLMSGTLEMYIFRFESLRIDEFFHYVSIVITKGSFISYQSVTDLCKIRIHLIDNFLRIVYQPLVRL